MMKMRLTYPYQLSARHGFTILEMLIVVTILALLAGILAPILADEAENARDGRRGADLRSIASTLAHYKQVTGGYPSTGGAWQGDASIYGGFGYGVGGYIPDLVPDYLPFLPKDPNPIYPTVGTGGYMYRSDGIDYKFVLNDTPSEYYVSNPFYDPTRPLTGWQVSSPGGYNW